MTAAEVKQYVRDTLLAQRTIAQEILVLDAIVDLVAQALTENIPTWTNALTFQTDGTDSGAFCLYPDTNSKIRFWKTLVDDNLNNAPPTNPATTSNAYWEEVSPSDSSSIKEWAAGIYGDGLVIVYFDLVGDGTGWKLYKLNNATRPFESTNFETELLAGDWVEMSAGILTSIDTSGLTIAVDFNGGKFRNHYGSATLAGNKAITLSNAANGLELQLFIVVDAAGRELTFPSTVKMKKSAGDWDSATYKWISPEAGTYHLILSFNNTNWLMNISDAY